MASTLDTSNANTDYLAGSGAPEGHVPFRSRGAQGPAQPAPADVGPDGLPLPSLRDTSLRLILLLTLAMQCLSWWILGGYQLADSIEYVENAQALVHGQDVVDSHAIRSFFFPALLSPALWIADLLGIEDQRPLFGVFRLFQMLLGLALVAISARLGARIGGRRAGLASALFVAANPVFLQYTVSPVTDIAAALAVGLGVNALISPKKRGLVAGLWLGVGILSAYKTLPIVGAVGLVQTLRAWRDPEQRRVWAGLLLGVAAMIGMQILLDWFTYGIAGFSIQRYFFVNFGPMMSKPFFILGIDSVALALYDLGREALDAQSGNVTREIRGRFPPHWYVTQVHQFYVGPLVALLGLGLWRSWRKPAWRTSVPLAVTLLYVSVLSIKGTKDYRLWLPLLAIFTPMVGLGWSVLWGAKDSALWRKAAALLCLVAAVGLGLHQLQDRNTRNFAGYWEAIDWINDKAAQRLAEDPDAEPLKVASAYHWAVFMREGTGVELTKLPHQLDGWGYLAPEQRRGDLFALLEQDYLIMHEPVLRNPDHDDLLRVVGRNFVVEALLWDRADYEDLGPIMVLRHEPDEERDQDSRTLYQVIEDADVQDYIRAHDFPEPMRMVRPELNEEIWALGFEYEVLPPHGHGWVTYHYYNAGAQPQANYVVLDRLTTYDESAFWQNNHAPAWGVHRTKSWKTGWIVRESWPVIACQDPYVWRGAYRPLGGAYRRGDLMPVNLWLDFVTQYWKCRTCGNQLDTPECCPEVDHFLPDGTATNGDIAISGRLERARWGADGPLRRGPLEGILSSPEGWRFSPDGLNRWGRLFMPVHPDARVPDNGRPLPN